MSFRNLTLAGLACLAGGPLFAQETNPYEAGFRKLDADKDGFVTAEEVGKDNPDAFSRLLKLGDENNDQKLTLQEFSKALTPLKPQQATENDRPDGPSNRRPAFDPLSFFKRLDQDGDGTLSKSELPEGMRDRFQATFERTGKETLTPEEFASVMREGFGQRPGGNPRGPEAIRGYFVRMDQDEDGKVTKEEVPERARAQFGPLFQKLGKESFTLEEYADYVAKMQESLRSGDERPQGEFRGSRFEGQAGGPVFFGMLDKDQNGKLSPTELAYAITLLEKLDRNEDGELDLFELMGGRPGGPGSGGPAMRREGGNPGSDSARPERPRRPEGAGNPNRPERPAGDDFAKNFFERFDANGDGSISKAEAPERLAENFGTLDQNNDGKLSFEEFQKSVGPRGRRPNN